MARFVRPLVALRILENFGPETPQEPLSRSFPVISSGSQAALSDGQQRPFNNLREPYETKDEIAR